MDMRGGLCTSSIAGTTLALNVGAEWSALFHVSEVSQSQGLPAVCLKTLNI
jgi:hypothetical protein